MKKAKVFHVITKLELGGAQKVTLMTLERLPREHYDLTLIANPEGLLVDWANRIPGLTRHWIPSLVREVRPLQDLTTLFVLWRLFRKEKPDIVHTHSSKAGILGRWAAWLAGVPQIFHTAHGFGFNDFQRPMVRNLYIWLEKISGRISTKLVVVSYANAAKGEKYGVVRPGEWLLCRDAISVKEFLSPDLPAGARPERNGNVVVGMVACFKPQKSPVDFVDVAAEVLRHAPHVQFVMAGDGELRPQVEARIRQHGIASQMTLLGWKKESEMPEIYRNLDIVALTSLWEGLPCVFSEAMANALPVVATNVDGAREAITHEDNGFLHEPHDVQGMAQSIVKLVKDSDLRRTMGERGKSRVMEFDIGTSVANLEAAYQQCLKLS